ncbi:MAG TPA: glycosyltransferase family 1 protein [Clostridiaceae bacterium]|nr:glycosyltransferase family 1 protein [Clostridiaceae bacterium]
MTDEPIRVLQIVLGLNRTGIDNVVMDLYRHLDHNQIQFDFVVFGKERGTHEDEVENLGGRIFHVPTRSSNPFASTAALKKVFRTYQYKIVHSHQDCLSGGILKLAKQCDIPIRIAHAHTTNLPAGWRRFYYSISKRSIAKYANYFIGCTERSGRWMFGDEVVNSNAFTVLKNAIDTRLFAFDLTTRNGWRNRLGFHDEPLVIHVGRLAFAKNHSYLFNIFKAFKEHFPTAKLVLVGDGELASALKKQVAEFDLVSSVYFLGERDDIPELLNAADIMVMPSLFEGLPLACIESQTAGLPTLISDTIDPIVKFTPIIEKEKLTTPPGQWADRMCQMLQKAATRRDYIAEAQAAHFDILVQSEYLMGLYQGYLAGVKV